MKLHCKSIGKFNKTSGLILQMSGQIHHQGENSSIFLFKNIMLDIFVHIFIITTTTIKL